MENGMTPVWIRTFTPFLDEWGPGLRLELSDADGLLHLRGEMRWRKEEESVYLPIVRSLETDFLAQHLFQRWDALDTIEAIR